MFEDCLLDFGGRTKTQSPLTVALSFLLQSAAVGILVLMPLIHTETLPRHHLTRFLMPPLPPPAPATPPAATPKVRLTPRPVRPSQEIVAPTVIPQHAAILVEEPPPPGPMVGVVNEASGIASLTSRDILGVVPREVETSLPSPPTERIKVGGIVAAAKLIRQPQPIYPPLARQARIQGTVRLEAVISRDGTIENLTVLSGHPLLISAAMEAVRQWRYQPTLLNGVPVEVETTVEVHFTLGG